MISFLSFPSFPCSYTISDLLYYKRQQENSICATKNVASRGGYDIYRSRKEKRLGIATVRKTI